MVGEARERREAVESIGSSADGISVEAEGVVQQPSNLLRLHAIQEEDERRKRRGRIDRERAEEEEEEGGREGDKIRKAGGRGFATNGRELTVYCVGDSGERVPKEAVGKIGNIRYGEVTRMALVGHSLGAREASPTRKTKLAFYAQEQRNGHLQVQSL